MDHIGINWVFDDPSRFRTMLSCPDTVIGDDDLMVSGRFPPSNIFWYWRSAARWAGGSEVGCGVHGIADRPDRYAYAIGTWVNCDHWSGHDGNRWGYRNMFELVPPEVMEDARSGRALIIIDMLNEGFQDDLLYSFLHGSCDRYGIPPSSLLYLSGNLLERDQYLRWAAENHVDPSVNMVSFCHWHYEAQRLSCDVEWEDHERIKRGNGRSIRTFNCLNRVQRAHREYLFLRLLDADMLRHGLVSHGELLGHDDWNHFGIGDGIVERARACLPMVVDDGDFSLNKAMQINPDIYLRSWISVVTETHALDDPRNLFLSEKICKPMLALQPFMVLGHPGTLERLRGMGYRTFPGLIDESYDHRDLIARTDMVINNLRMLTVVRDKWAWLETCRDACLHNRRVLLSRDFFDSRECRDIMRIYAASR